MTEARWLSWIWTVGLALLVLIHLLPVIGVVGADALQRLYGVQADGPDLQLLLRHRALLFGVIGGILLLAAFNPNYRNLALAAGWFSVLGFIVLAGQIGPVNEALTRVLWVDYVALVVLAALTGCKLWVGR